MNLCGDGTNLCFFSCSSCSCLVSMNWNVNIVKAVKEESPCCLRCWFCLFMLSMSFWMDPFFLFMNWIYSVACFRIWARDVYNHMFTTSIHDHVLTRCQQCLRNQINCPPKSVRNLHFYIYHVLTTRTHSKYFEPIYFRNGNLMR